MRILDEATQPEAGATPAPTDPAAREAGGALPPGRVPALDGLRGLAVAAVLLFHGGQLTGGYLGVDLFFVLSGFLITDLLITQYRTTADIALAPFWVRRARRLLPALLALLIGVALWAALIADPTDLSRVRADGFATLFYAANWHTILSGHTYWDLFATPSPLEHTWSLAIEEQFYLLWPLGLWALFKFTAASLKTLLWICLGLALASEVALWVLFDPADTTRAYEGTDTRGAAILVGAALATALTLWGPVRGRTARMVLELAAAGAAVVVLISWLWLDGQSSLLYRGGFLVTELAVVVILVAIVNPQGGILGRAFSFRPIVGLGLISYGVYLYHVPIFLVLSADRLGFDGWPLLAIQVGVTLLVATGSYLVLEQPIRTRGLPALAPARYVVPGAVVLTIAVLFLATSAATVDPAAAGNPSGTDFDGVPPGVKRIMFLGDSVGFSLGIETADISLASGNNPGVAVRAPAGCTVFSNEYPTRTSDKHIEGLPIDCDASWAGDAEELRPDVAVVLFGGPTKSDAQVDGRWVAPCDPAWNAAYKTELASGVDQLARHSSHVVLATTPHYDYGFNPKEGRAWVDCVNGVNRAIAAEHPNVTLVDLDAYLCPDGTCRRDDEAGERLRPDGVHFKGVGGRTVAQWVLTQLP